MQRWRTCACCAGLTTRTRPSARSAQSSWTASGTRPGNGAGGRGAEPLPGRGRVSVRRRRARTV